jgi:hypothetical protein
MAIQRRTLDLLPEIFRTKPNEKFLNATLDQLVQPSQLQKIDGYIGRKVGLGVSAADSYLLEPDVERATYQLEPGICYKTVDGQFTEDLITYPGLIDALTVRSANTTRHDRLFTSEYYTWDPFVDFDKLINFSQYYWLPSGPPSVDVSSTEISLTDEYTITRNTNSYTFSDIAGDNPVLTVIRGGNYKFIVNQTGNPIYIQTAPGAAGYVTGQPNQSARDVLGVSNNGEDNGIVEFLVPTAGAQNFYLNMPMVSNVDLVTNLRFDQINNRLVSEFNDEHNGIDSITDLKNRTLIFTNSNTGPKEDSGWQIQGRFDEYNFDANDTVFDPAEEITLKSDRYSVWRIEYVYDAAGRNPFMVLRNIKSINNLTKVHVQYGTTHNNMYFYKTAEGFFEQQPLISAINDVLYYQDANNENNFGIIRIVDEVNQLELNINDIIGRKTYTSPTGVVFTNGLKVQFRGRTLPNSYQDNSYYVEGVGSSIKLVDIRDLKTPETYTVSETVPFDLFGYDESPWDASLNAPIDQDYFTINRASPDKNAWSRSNRWFHENIITASAEYNNSSPVLDQTARATRPILEFKAGLCLFNHGTEGVAAVDIIDFRSTDAMSLVRGSKTYLTDGYLLTNGSRVIFANDTDPAVRNKIYKVELVDPIGITVDPSQLSDPIINLTLDTDGNINEDQVVFCLSGTSLQGKAYRFSGDEWILAQQKTKVNQPPLFNIFDIDGKELCDQNTYPSSNFNGTHLFSYSTGSGPVDSVLGIKLSYLNINNVGDIVFKNNLYNDSFVYTENNISSTTNIATGFIRQFEDRTNFSLLTGWQTAITPLDQPQIFTFVTDEIVVDNILFNCDIAAVDQDNAVTVYINNEYILPKDYSYITTLDTTVITPTKTIDPNSIIHIHIVSDQVSKIAYYEIPHNLADNSVNMEFKTITLGTIRNHFVGLAQRVTDLSGDILGRNNLRDLGNIIPYGSQIIEHSSPLQFAATFVKDGNINFFNSLNYSAREYEKFKNKLIDALTHNDYQGTAADRLDSALLDINSGRDPTSSFYWTDTLPSGKVYVETNFTITPISDNQFALTRIYDFTKANYTAILVYLNDELLIKDLDYTVAVDTARLIIEIDLAVDDIITIREYESTSGSFIPSTPTKLGLYDAYVPEIFTDDSYSTPQTIIQGHDGSKTIALGDNRDDVLLEFEKRIFNNLKLVGNTVPLHYYDVIPGKFRTTDYSESEITELMYNSFLTWTSWNKLDYKTQEYDQANSKTWNYSSATDRVDNSLLLGGWRGNLNKFYDTDLPHLRPWEMLGFSIKPVWWINAYGAAPYTKDNLVLWDDLATGKVDDPAGSYYLPQFARPGLLDIIPTGDEGQLSDIFDILVANYDRLSLKKSWVVGDQGPVETAWRRSSTWPFAVQQLLAQTKPAQYFALNADRDLYRYNDDLNQYLYDNRYRLNSTNIVVYGKGTIKHSYINWCVDFSHLQGVDATQKITDIFNNTKVQLVYRTGGFTDKKYLKIFTEKSSPNSLNTSLLLPDESYEVLLYKNEIFDRVSYSSVIIQKVDNGYAVYGNSKLNLYFNIFESVINGNYRSTTVGDTTIKIPNDFSDNVVLVPYGYVFTSKSAVADFLISYGRWLESKGFIFDDKQNDYYLNWNQIVQEFLYWSQQGWDIGSIINLNPAAYQLKISKRRAVVAPIMGQTADDFVLNQNLTVINNNKLVFDRIGNEFVIKSTDENSIAFIDLKFTAYEHVLVFNNTSIFNDLLYDPTTGGRQLRLKIVGFNTGKWDGTINAPGFIFNQNNVADWSPNKNYSKGEIVKYKNIYYSAAYRIQPADAFNIVDWVATEYSSIKQGLLPNLSLKADQVRDYYHKNVANLEQDADLLGFGLIGFKPRSYMQGLNLDDISQTNIYSGFVKNKGTRQALNLFKSARLEKELTDYQIYENWAIQTGQFGATANRSYIELQLDSSIVTGNPGTVKVVSDVSDITANQNIPLTKIYKSSYNVTDTNIFPIIEYRNIDQSLPSSGFVNVDDISIQVFDLNELTDIINNLDSIVDGTPIWVAKDNGYEWNVYRISVIDPTPITLLDNLNGTATLVFDGHHNLFANDIIIIKYFHSILDGAYIVNSIVSLDKITISLSLPDRVTEIVASGVAFKLNSARVEQPSAIADLPFLLEIKDGEKIWVNNISNGNWGVLEKNNVFVDSYPTVIEDTPQQDSNFGSSVSQSPDGKIALVGASGYNSGAGAVYVFGQSSSTGDLQPGPIFTLGVTAQTGYGHIVESGGLGWNVVGAPLSKSEEGYAVLIREFLETGNFVEWQLLTVPVGRGDSTQSEFGYSAAISSDGRILWVGAPGVDKVFGYQLVEFELQKMRILGDGQTKSFTISDNIMVSTAYEISVVVNNNLRTPITDYTLAAGKVIFDSAPSLGSRIEINRKHFYSADGDSSTTTFVLDMLYGATNIDTLSVKVANQLLRPYYDYTFNSANRNLTLNSAPAIGSLLTVEARDHFKYFTTITSPIANPRRFGSSIATTGDGRQVVIGAIDAEGNDSTDTVGQAFIFDRDVQRFIITNLSTLSYTTTSAIVGRPEVLINNKRQVNGNYYFKNKSYTSVTDTITFNSNIINMGDFVDIETNNMAYVKTLNLPGDIQSAQFGYAIAICETNCSIYVGAPNVSLLNADSSGNVSRFINQSRLYGSILGTVTSPTVTIGNVIRINNVYITLTGTTLNSVVDDINDAGIPNVVASNTNNKIYISLINLKAAPLTNRLYILPGSGTAIDDLGLDLFPYMQTLVNPFPKEYAHFGSSIDVSSNALSIAIGAPNAPTNLIVTLDDNATFLDSKSTVIKDIQTDSGAVYTFDYLGSSDDTFLNPGRFVFGQQVTDIFVQPQSLYGTSVNYSNGKLLIGSPAYHKPDSESQIGRLVRFNNTEQVSSWTVAREEVAQVNVELIDSVFIYNHPTNKILTYLDYIDPLQGKILGPAQQNIDIISPTDPAAYNNGTKNIYDSTWGNERVGIIWWDVTNSKFIDYHQSTIDYRAKRLSQLFKGSSIDVYQWIQSDVHPAEYAGDGTPKSTTSYSILSDVNNNGVLVTQYYFWVKGLTSVNKNRGKTLSTTTIQQYIENPKSSGIPFIAFLDKNSVALYNTEAFISDTNSVLHIEFDKIETENNIHAEYELIRENDPSQFLSTQIYRKFQDSLCGKDTAGNLVPDPKLSLTNISGVGFRPRQTMFIDRYTALRNYITSINRVLSKHPIVEMKSLTLLNSKEEEPTKEAAVWDFLVNDLDELSYQNLNAVSTGYRYLIKSDLSNGSRWAIYTVQADKSLLLTRIQNFNTTEYWEYINWYKDDYDLLNKPIKEVSTYSLLLTLNNSVNVDDIVKVTANAQNKFELYRLDTDGWTRVGLENGTIKISDGLFDYSIDNHGFDIEVFDAQHWDEEPTIETRQIIKAINEELLIDDLANYRIDSIILMFNYITSTQTSIEWLSKTSLIDVHHTLRELKPFTILKQDNQTFIEDYIQEVKPYHAQVKEFNLTYKGDDNYVGDTTDFDLPAFYNNELGKFISPRHMLKAAIVRGEGAYLLSDPIWDSGLYSQWKNNFTLSIDSVNITDGGSGYTTKPTVVIIGECTTPATMVSKISTAGKVISVEVIYSGVGYTSTPLITFVGGNGAGATACAICSPGTVRSYKTTIKFDRTDLTTSVVDWEPLTAYDQNQLLRYNNKVWKASYADGSTLSKTSFDPLDYTAASIDELSGVDRTMGLYIPRESSPGIDLALLVSGTDYPGVQVLGPRFNQNTGLDVGNFDINPYDNLEFGPEGKPTYSDSILDTIYSRQDFLEAYLGATTDIDVVGGAYVDNYNSHAPEELLPAAIFDTLSLRVKTRPGADYLNVGFSADEKTRFFEYDGVTTTFYFGDLVVDPFAVRLYNITQGTTLRFEYVTPAAGVIDYTINWLNKTITILSGATVGETIGITSFGIGGGNQLILEHYAVEDYLNSDGTVTIIVPVRHTEIKEAMIKCNGSRITNYIFEEYETYHTKIIFGAVDTDSDGIQNPDKVKYFGTQPLEIGDYLHVCIMGFAVGETSSLYVTHNEGIVHTSSHPSTQYFYVTNATITSYSLSQDIQGTNPDTALVEINGQRARPPEGFEWYGDATTVDFTLSLETLTPVSSIADNDIRVYVDDIQKRLYEDFIVSLDDGSSDRVVTFTTAPADRAHIKIFVRTSSDYSISRLANVSDLNTITFKTPLTVGDHIMITTYNNTTELDQIIKVYQGPTQSGYTTMQAYDAVEYDSDNFDKQEGVTIDQSVYDLGREITDASRLTVHVNGIKKYSGVHWKMQADDSSKLEFYSIDVQIADVVTVTLKSEIVVPKKLEFRLFKDMRGNTAIYRGDEGNATTLAQQVDTTDDVIYVYDVTKLATPNLESNVYGVVIIDGERITYKYINASNNSISGLRRGTAGTAISSHAANAICHNISIDMYLNWSYNKIWYAQGASTASDGRPLQKTVTVPAKFLLGLD